MTIKFTKQKMKLMRKHKKSLMEIENEQNSLKNPKYFDWILTHVDEPLSERIIMTNTIRTASVDDIPF